VISPVVDVTITGAGVFGYRLAAQAALRLRQTRDGDA
jgi:3-dehydroquinate dehydratase